MISSTPVPPGLEGRTDVVVAVVPYVPTAALRLLPRDTLTFEDAAHYDGGPDGTGILQRVVAEARRFLRPGGALLLELGGEQAELVRPAHGAPRLRLGRDLVRRGRGPARPRGHAALTPLPAAPGRCSTASGAHRRAKTRATLVRSTTCQRGSWERYSARAVRGAHTT